MSSKIRNVDGGLGDQAGQGFEVLNQKVTILKSALRFLQRGNQTAFDNKLAELMLDPPEAAKFMTKVIEKGKIATFTQALMKAMSPNTRAAFQQAFVIPTAAEEVGQ
jgi:glycerol-3-phosphate responsive antiterminator